ncbi:MAG: hypothetical protein V1661_02885 [bacterium]
MKRAIIILAALILLAGAGCAKQNLGLNFDKMQQALTETGNALGWTGGVIDRPPGEDNFFGQSFIFYGPVKEESVETVVSDNIEIMELSTEEYATGVYKKDECFKGAGKPIDVYGISGCCLNDAKKGTSRAIMSTGRYVFRASDYFYANCKAGEYLKKFWGEYLKK